MFSQPGAPRPMLNDPYGQPPGTPRPGPDGLSRQGPRLGPMGSQDPFSTPQSRLQEPFPHPGSQTPKHPSVSEDGFTQSPSRRPSQTPGHDPFEQAPMTPRPQSVEKMEMKDHSGVGNNGTDPGQLCNNPQIPGGSTEAQGVALAESEERLKQVHEYCCSILNLIISTLLSKFNICTGFILFKRFRNRMFFFFLTS